MLLQIDQDGGVGLAFTDRIIVHAQNAWCGHGEHYLADPTQKSSTTCGQSEGSQYAGSAFTACLQRHALLHTSKAISATGFGADLTDETFTEDTTGAGGIGAEETSDM